MKPQNLNQISLFTQTIAVSAALVATLCLTGARAQADPPNPFANLAQAQQQVTSYEKADPNGPINLHSSDVDYTVGRLTTVLSLTPAQQSTARDILAAQNKRASALRSDKSLNRDDRFVQNEAIYRNTVSCFNATLTDDQLLKAKLIQSESDVDPDQLRAEKLFMLDARFAAMQTPDAATQWGNALNLTVQQKMALLPAIEDEGKALDAIAKDKTLSADDSRIQTQKVMVAFERNIDSQLTPDQKTHLLTVWLVGLMPNATNPRGCAAAH